MWAVVTDRVALATAGILLVGLAVAPIVPSALSLLTLTTLTVAALGTRWPTPTDATSSTPTP